MSLTVLTPTGSRPEAFALCEKWMARQTYKGAIQWICADDGDVPTRFTMGQKVIYRDAKPGVVTLADNLLAAIGHVEGEKVVVVEDD